MGMYPKRFSALICAMRYGFCVGLTAILLLVASCYGGSQTSPQQERVDEQCSDEVMKHLLMASLAYDSRKYSWAIAELEQAIKIDPKCAKAHYNLGLCYEYNQKGIRRGDGYEADKAISEYVRTIEIDPTYALAYLNLGLIYRERGEYNLAIKSYKEALELDLEPHIKKQVLMGIAMVYEEQGKYPDAIVQIEKTIAVDPDDIKARSWLASVLVKAQMYDRAVIEYEKLLNMQPAHVASHVNLAWAYFKSGKNIDKAMKHAQMGVMIAPQLAQSHDVLGRIFYEKRMYDEALAQFKKALELVPNEDKIYQATMYYLLGKTYYKKGVPTEAIRELKQTLSLDPDFDEADEVKKILKELAN